jgi:hypothetical protein
MSQNTVCDCRNTDCSDVVKYTMNNASLTVNCRRQQNVRDKETNGIRVHANNQHTKRKEGESKG